MKKVVFGSTFERRFAHSIRGQFRLSPLAAVLAGLTALAPGFSAAADDVRSSAEIQAEVLRLKELLQKEEQALAEKGGGPAAAPVPAQGEGTQGSTEAQPQAQTAEAPTAEKEEVTLDQVVVRSRNRIERLQDVPLSVSVVSGKELDRLGANDIDSITKRAGNVQWNPGNQRTSSLSVRGIGKQGQTEAQDPSVGVIVDGVSYAYNALTSSFDFTDVEAVEVTRGPQGTLLGKNASLGVVNISTRRPSFTPSADWSLTVGERDRLVGSFAGGGPVVNDLLAWRASLNVQRGAGDIENLYNKDVTYQNIDRVSGRLQFLLTPSETFNARLALDAQPRASETTNGRTINTPTPTVFAGLNKSGTLKGTNTNPLSTDASVRLARRWFTQDSYRYETDYLYGGGVNAVNNDSARGLVTGSNGAAVELNWTLGNHTLTSITAYKDYHFDAVNDEGTPFDIHRNSGGFWNDYKQVSQELRLSSQAGGFVDYQTGLYYIDVDNSAEYRRVWGNDAGAWYATKDQYNRLDTDASGRLLLQNSLDRLSMAFNSPVGLQQVDNKSSAVFAQANWHISDPLTVTTGARLTWDNRKNTASSFIKDNGNGGELNPDQVNGISQGGFKSNGTGVLDAANTNAQKSLADFVANKYFGKTIAGAPGDTYNGLTPAQQQQVADAKTIRAGQVGVLFNEAAAEPFKEVLPAFVVSPSYKINDNLTTYVSLQHGEKAGISQFTNGRSNLVKAEKTTAYELGFKSALLDKTLILNADIFLMDIKNYQQSVRVVDEYTTALNPTQPIAYTSATGNVPKVQAKGIEIDGVYGGIRHTTLRFSGSYNDASYKDFPNSAQPVENGYAGADPYQNVSGQTLPGASKYTFNVGADYRLPVFDTKEFHFSFNTAYNSSFKSDNSLSDYSKIPGRFITDLSVGLGRQDKVFDVNLLVKNLFNDDTPQTLTWNSYTPATPRWIGVGFTGKI